MNSSEILTYLTLPEATFEDLFNRLSLTDWKSLIWDFLYEKTEIKNLDSLFVKEGTSFMKLLLQQVDSLSYVKKEVFLNALQEIFSDVLNEGNFQITIPFISYFGSWLDENLLIQYVVLNQMAPQELREKGCFKIAEKLNSSKHSFWTIIDYFKEPFLIPYYLISLSNSSPRKVFELLSKDKFGKYMHTKSRLSQLWFIIGNSLDKINSNIELLDGFIDDLPSYSESLINIIKIEFLEKDPKYCNLLNQFQNRISIPEQIKFIINNEYSLIEALKFSHDKLYPKGTKKFVLEAINSYFIDHVSILVANNLGLFSRLGISINQITKILNEKELLSLPSKNLTLFSYPRIFLIDHEELLKNSFDFFIFNAFKGYTFFGSKKVYHYLNKFDFKQKLDLLLSKDFHFISFDIKAIDYINYLSGDLYKILFPKSKHHNHKIIDHDSNSNILSAVEKGDGIGVANGNLLNDILNSEKYLVLLTPDEIYGYINQSVPIYKQENILMSFNRIFPHNCWQLNLNKAHVEKNKELIFRIIGVGFFLIELVQFDNYEKYAEEVLNINSTKSHKSKSELIKNIILAMKSSYSFFNLSYYGQVYLKENNHRSMFSLSDSFTTDALINNSVANNIFNEYYQLRQKTDEIMNYILDVTKIRNIDEMNKLLSTLHLAKMHLRIYNYYDAYKIIREALEFFYKGQKPSEREEILNAYNFFNLPDKISISN
jgi:hypothetical protein